jgi:hypothetical protein
MRTIADFKKNNYLGMKLHTPYEPPTIMRMNIKKQGFETEHLAFEETTSVELLDWSKAIIEKQKLSIFETGKKTTVEVRESIKGQNGKTISFSFKGLSPQEVKQLILEKIK